MWQTPTQERQYQTFETNACGIFAVLNCIESWMLKFGKPANYSDRFIASLVGGLMGNLPTIVMDTIKTNGLLDESKFPYGGVNQADYYNKKYVTSSMLTEAKNWFNDYDISYEYVNFGLGKVEQTKLALKDCPLVGVITNNNGTTHAMMIFDDNSYFDSYEPFIKKLDYNRLHYAIKVIVKQKTMAYKYFKPSEVIGLKPEFVSLLDKARDISGIPFIITSGYRDAQHNENVGGVKDSAHTFGLAVDLRVKDGVSGGKILIALIKVGLNRFGFYKDGHIHIDYDLTKPNPCYWVV